MAKGFDIFLKDRAISCDISINNKSAYDIFLGRPSIQADIFITSIPLHMAIDPADEIVLIIDSNRPNAEIYGSLRVYNDIYLGVSINETVKKYEPINNDIYIGSKVTENVTKIAAPEESVGIELDVSAAFVVRRLRYLYDIDNNSLNNIDSMTLEDLTYIVVPI